MNEFCRKVSRGQVWMLVEKSAYNIPGDSLQSGTRPWLVVSNDKCNQASPTVTVVPLTTQNKTPLPTHVAFHQAGKDQTILCEQIRTIPARFFDDPTASYRWTMSDKYMRLVDDALCAQLGLSLCFPNSDRFWESLERLVRAKVKQAVEDSRVQAMDVGKLCAILDDKTNTLIADAATTEPVVHIAPTAPVVQTEPPVEVKPETKPETKPEVQPTGWVPHKPSKRRNKWTKEDMRTFLDDCEKMPLKEVSEKYDMKLSTLYAQKSNFKRILSADGQ